MIILNHNHLYYFWTVAREGSIAKACKKLCLAQPTISTQIIQFEKFLGVKLFDRQKKKLILTDAGRLVLDYASQIFNYSQEMLDSIKDRPTRQVIRIQIGIADQVSRQVSHRLLTELFLLKRGVEPTVTEGSIIELLGGLRTHALDLVLSNIDVPLEKTADFLSVNVGSLPIHFVAAPALARKAKNFPRILSQIPLLLPTRASPIWGKLETFFNRHRLEPKIAGEIQDVELLRLLALEGIGAAPLNQIAVERDLRSGALVRLNQKPTGIYKTVWLIAKKRHRLNSIAQYLLDHFRFNKSDRS